MEVIYGLDTIQRKLDRSVLAIGNFDGLHRGHQQLLAQGALFAEEARAPLVVLTFEPHPVSILRPENAPTKLMRLGDKLSALARHNVNITVVASSTPELFEVEPDDFIERLVDTFHPTHIVEGSTFGFGRGRRGDADTLRALGGRFGFEACIIDPVTLTFSADETLTISSSVIRKLLTEHRVHRAALSLTRPYALVGTVVSGAGRGESLGFPTANVNNVETLIPADGVYAGTAQVGDATGPAAISIGSNPTFGPGARKIEAHLLDFHGALGGQSIRIEFVKWLRAQRAFDTPADLIAQITRDVEQVRRQYSETERRYQSPEPDHGGVTR